MPNIATNAAACPIWCATDHNREPDEMAGGYYHDSEPTTLDVTYPQTLDALEQLHVQVTQFAPSSGTAQEPRIDIENNERLLASLSPEDARELAAMLAQAAEAAESQQP
jgi:phytoene dehydrogenase-like protein